jgi:hypothetical protein
MNHTIKLSFLVGLLGLASCTDSDPGAGIDTPPPPGSTAGGVDTTFDHENNGISLWELVDRLQQEGPPEYTSHVHSCPKVRYATLGRVLTSLGVNLNVASPSTTSAAYLYKNGANAMGAPNYANRIREAINISTSAASREFDIFAAAAPEIIANISTLERCKTGGAPAALFNDQNQCQVSGITCLLGVPARAAHLDLCNITIQRASTPAVGKPLAVAALLAAAYTCE